jgi:hypothetical protein
MPVVVVVRVLEQVVKELRRCRCVWGGSEGGQTKERVVEKGGNVVWQILTAW